MRKSVLDYKTDLNFPAPKLGAPRKALIKRKILKFVVMHRWGVLSPSHDDSMSRNKDKLIVLRFSYLDRKTSVEVKQIVLIIHYVTKFFLSIPEE